MILKPVNFLFHNKIILTKDNIIESENNVKFVKTFNNCPDNVFKDGEVSKKIDEYSFEIKYDSCFYIVYHSITNEFNISLLLKSNIIKQ